MSADGRSHREELTEVCLFSALFLRADINHKNYLSDAELKTFFNSFDTNCESEYS